MKITNEESLSKKYAIISYSHADVKDFKSEIEMFKNNGIRYWFDENMTAGTEAYDEQFRKMLDNPNCKGIMFFINDDFLLSGPCADEMKYFKDKYRSDNTLNSDKFCLCILPEGYPYSDSNAIYDRVYKYADEKYDDEKKRQMLRHLNGHIDLFLELNQHGKILHATLGNGNNYISDYCEKGQTFHNAGIISGFEYGYDTFGTFPQKVETKENDLKKIEFRDADKKPALYKSVEWLTFGNNMLLSKKLLFAIDYLSLKYPLENNSCNNNKTITEQIKDKFDKYFRQGDNKREIKTVRFLSERELQALLRGTKGDIKKSREILLPEPTDFAEISNRKDSHAFWLAGDMDNARRVDVATEGLSEHEAGVELYYVRIVIEIEK